MSLHSEEIFYNLLSRAEPFLIFAPSSFRNRLADNMQALYHFLGENDDFHFDEVALETEKMLDDSQREKFDPLLEVDISNFNSENMSLKQKLKSINERLVEVEMKIRPEPVPAIDKIKNYVKLNRTITNEKVREICFINRDMAWTLLKKLVDESLIEKKGAGTNSFYELNTSFQQTPMSLQQNARTSLQQSERPTKEMQQARLQKIRDYLTSNSTIDNKKVREICGITSVQVSSHLLNKFVKEGVIEKKGQGSGTYYEVKTDDI